MISELAIAEISRLEDEGLRPSARDIIRLNALALEYDAARARSAFISTEYLPRVVAIDDSTYLREPALGHEIWLDKIARNFHIVDIDTILAIKAFALSRSPDELPDPNCRGEVLKALEEFQTRMANYCRQQIYAALEFVQTGFDQCAHEFSAPSKNKRVSPPKIGVNELDYCLALGVLNEGRVALWGVTAAELKEMPRRQVEALIRRAQEYRPELSRVKGNPGDFELGLFNRTLDEITERLISEKEKENGNVA